MHVRNDKFTLVEIKPCFIMHIYTHQNQTLRLDIIDSFPKLVVGHYFDLGGLVKNENTAI